MPIPAAGVLAGLGPRTVLLIHTAGTAREWRDRLKVAGPVLTLPVAFEATIDRADFVACHNQSYVTRYDLLKA